MFVGLLYVCRAETAETAETGERVVRDADSMMMSVLLLAKEGETKGGETKGLAKGGAREVSECVSECL